MKINELIVYQEDLDEGVGSFIGKTAGNIVGGLGAAWRDAKKGYQDAKASWDEPGTGGATTPSGGATTPTTGGGATGGGAPSLTDPASIGGGAGASSGTGQTTQTPTGQTAQTPTGQTAQTPTGQTAQTPTAAPAGDVGSIMQAIDKLDPASKKQLAGQLEKNIKDTTAAAGAKPNTGNEPTSPEQRAAHIAAGGKFDNETGQPIPPPGTEKPADATTATPPAGAAPANTGGEYDPAKAAADKAAKNQADAEQRNADIERTKQANAQAAQADADLVAAVKAAKAKPAFDQTAQDKLTIRQGAAKGIHESKKKKKKPILEFKSKFLKMKI